MGGRELGEHRPTSGDFTCIVPYSPQALTSMMSPSRFHIVFYEVAWEGAGPVIALRGWATGTGQYGRRMSIYIRSVNLQDYYTTPHQLPHQKQAETGPMVGLIRWISASRNDKNASALGRPRRDVTSVGGGSGRNGDRFRRIELGEFRSEVGGDGGACGGELFYGIDVVVGNLNKETGRE